MCAIPLQIEKEKFRLFFILMHVPSTVVKHLTRIASTGYEKMRAQVTIDQLGTDDDNERSDDDVPEVSSRRDPRLLCTSTHVKRLLVRNGG